jgi:hypothetical protein
VHIERCVPQPHDAASQARQLQPDDPPGDAKVMPDALQLMASCIN